jgi:hypothetical protein
MVNARGLMDDISQLIFPLKTEVDIFRSETSVSVDSVELYTN